MKITEVLRQPELRHEEMLRRLAGDYRECELACLPYQSISGQEKTVWYPAFARSPSYRRYPAGGDPLEYEPYLRYAYDSGTASGVTRNEAILHGILEVIERDSLSIALLNWYVRVPPRVRAVNPSSLPPGLRALWNEIEYFIRCPILLLDMSTDIGVPACAALPYIQGIFPGSLGSGASLNPAYAVERALTELAQAVHFARLDIDTTHQSRLASLRAWPFLERCALLDKEPFRSACRIVGDFTGWHASDAAVGGVDAQIKILTSMLEQHGFQAYFFPWTPADCECPVITVLIPGLDWFAMVHSATAVLPTGRAMAVLREISPDLPG